MVFKFATFDPRQDPDDFNPAFPPTPSSSSSATLCQPCESTCSFTRAVIGRLVSAGASLVLTSPAVAVDGHEIQDQSPETPFHSINFDVHPEFHPRQLKEFTLQELKVASLNFSNTKLLGKGGFGDVYEGQLADGSLVAIKRCKELCQVLMRQFNAEVMIGSIIPPHRNLLPLLGFCRTSESTELLLVSPFMINKCLASCLRERPDTQPPLDWPTRVKIATGAARGLCHLHDLSILHRDIKAANIMLDEEFEPCIGDFGLALFIDRRHDGCFEDCVQEAPVLPRDKSRARSYQDYSDVTTAVRGTFGHIAPEYLNTGKCSVKNDVFAFGVMILELVTGRKVLDFLRLGKNMDLMSFDWVNRHLEERSLENLVDSDLKGEYDEEEIEKLIQLALLCTQLAPGERPSMVQVLQLLEGHSIEEKWKEYQLKYRSQEPSLHNIHRDWIIPDSTSHLRADELSGPR
ncbi:BRASSINOSTEROID INSENSITIVE 1-associated receptor kinase 1 [Eucalyptus grandis]|uniref:Uncharacterized protein n=2 Tax=Eucalyptus grandis TaxID=71139 RepID=A0ACC3M5I3_EUCGR|nr:BRASSINOSTEROID INSENSITIVE 1-associated receptor kinase 1 [Eucalyptus grandis]KAK3446602.1 hypothetical protein EUGRSUZ_A02280 [Eucalyptus grandis]